MIGWIAAIAWLALWVGIFIYCLVLMWRDYGE